MRRLLELPIEAPRITVFLTLALTVGLGIFAAQIRVDSSMEMLLPVDDPERSYYEVVESLFGSEEVTVVGVFADDVFTPSTLAKIAELSSKFAALDGVREVVSLSTAPLVSVKDGIMSLGKLMPSVPATPEEAAEIRAKALNEPLYVRNIVSSDGTAAGINIVYEAMTDEEFQARRLEEQVRGIVGAMSGPEQYAVTGVPTIKLFGARYMEQDIARFMPLSILLVSGVLVWSFRTVRGVVVPLLTVLASVVWTTGAMVLAGSPINMGTLVLPSLIIVIGVAEAIHLVSQYYLELAPGRDRVDVVKHTVAHVGLPILVCTVTTMIGFAPFTLSPIQAIWDFGVYAILGVSASMVATFTLAPALLVLFPSPKKFQAHHDDNSWLTRGLVRVGKYAIAHSRMVFAGALVTCLVCLWGISKIVVVTDYLTFFSPASPVRVDNDRIANHLAGTQPIYVVVDGTGPNSVTRLEILAAIRDLEKFIGEQPKVDTTMSLLDYIHLLRRALQPEATDPLPDNQADIDQLLLLLNPTDVRAVVNREGSRANIIVRTRLSGSLEVEEFVRKVDEYAARHFPRDVHVRPTGTMVLLNRSADILAWGEINSLWQVIFTLFVVLSLMFLSVRMGLLSLVPNVILIIILFGIMGWSGISLNISTSMIASLAIGIAIDDTTHFLSNFNEALHRTGDQKAAVIETMTTVGRPMVFTSLALCAGFLIVCLSNFQPVRHFGYLSSITLGIGMIVELFVSPAMVTATKIITIWDLLFLKLGADPHKQIPLFKGLRLFQAKIVVLMARLAMAHKGDYIARRGEMKPELYVLLKGKADVLRSEGTGVIREMGRGDVIGEMGLVRQRPRSADVVAAEDLEYLVLDERFLDRMRRRYPRMASTVFFNLSQILSDRLEDTTDRLSEASARDAGA